MADMLPVLGPARGVNGRKGVKGKGGKGGGGWGDLGRSKWGEAFARCVCVCVCNIYPEISE